MEKRLIGRGDFKSLHATFCHAFSNYKVPFNLTEEEFDIRIHQKLHVNYDLSAATFDGDEMIGFILHTANTYEGIHTAFNGGTGVIPGFRNQKTGEELYEFLIPILIKHSIPRILLEVIDSNEQAIRLYEKVGFTFRRKFHCYKLENSKSMEKVEDTTEQGTIEDVIEDFADFEPSFVDSFNQLKLGNETVRIIKENGETVGFIIFQPQLGRISQIAIAKEYRKKSYGRALIASALARSDKKLTVMNVPQDEIGFHRFLTSSGFENQINQFEMELII